MTHGSTVGIEPLSYAQPVQRRGSGGRFLVWAVGGVVIGGMLIAALLPSLCRSGSAANRVKCAANLRQIGLAIALYAQDNGGQYPPSLAVLPAHEDITPAVMVCPASKDEATLTTDTAAAVAELKSAEADAPGHKNCLSYVYAGRGLNAKTILDTTVLAYEPLDNHNGEGTNVLFGDGHVEFIGKTAWTKIAAAAGVTTLPSLKARP